jgi:predicted restriction endonuclease
MYRTCGFPGCEVRFGDCEIHHVIEWIKQRGPTDLDNLLPLCSRHHHLVHEGRWSLTLDADRVVTVRRPDGTTSTHDTTVDVARRGVRSDTSELQRLMGEAVESAIKRRRVA